MELAIEATGLVKRYKDVVALDGVDLAVPRGTVLGLLGPNGAGKTTTVRVLTTLLKPDAGRATVAGVDVLADPGEVRRRIGLSGQYAAVDEYLTGYENLEMIGRLYHLGRRPSQERARVLLAQFRLEEAANRPTKTYSGGMRRRLDLAGSLVADPEVLFLDEPTTGLDPRSRIELWETIEDLVAEGTTVLLTTQYLDEADRLADRIVVIDQGAVIAEGTADELKGEIGGERLDVKLEDPADADRAVAALAEMCIENPTVSDHTVSAPVRTHTGMIAEAVRRLDEAGVGIDDISLHRPTLDDVFIALTGHAAAVEPSTELPVIEEVPS